MKLPSFFTASRRRQEGSYLLVALISTAVIGFTLLSYLTLASAQNRSTFRSLTWNSVMPIIEAGVEEGLAALNRNGTTNIANGTDGWTVPTAGTAIFYKTNTLSPGNWYELWVDATFSSSQPQVIVQGYAPAPLAKFDGPILAAAGVVAASVATAPPAVMRKVRVLTRLDAIYGKGLVARTNMDWHGNIMSDSFDSGDPTASTSGRYDMSKRRDKGSVASNGGSISMGGGDVFGSVATGPLGSISGGKVGDAAWMADSSKTGIQPGHSVNDMNVQFPSVPPPFGGATAFTPSGGTATYTNVNFGQGAVTTDVYPSPVPAGGVTTNSLTTVTSATYPVAILAGTVTTNTVTLTTATLPTPLPGGPITTNASAFIVTTFYPSPVPPGGVTTLTTNVQSSAYPVSGTYVGTVSTNTTAISNVKLSPLSGTYVAGSLVTRANGRFDYTRIDSYAYSLIIGYRYQTVTYTYASRTYTYVSAVNYTYTTSITNQVATTAAFTYILGTGNYQLSSLSMSGQQSMLVNGNAVLYVTGSTAMAGQSQIIIAPGASLKIYCGGSVDLHGNGIMNLSLDALQFSLFGLPSCTSIALGGNAAFTGTMYAPQADFSAGGGGNNQYDVVGSVIANTITMNGHFAFHYDERLGRDGPNRGYIISSWREE